MPAKKVLPEFPSEWHQEAYTEAVKRELLGAENRVAELKDLGLDSTDPAFQDAERAVAACHKELQRLGVEKKAAAKK